MTLQVIKAEDVRDGEPRMYAFDAKDADDRVASIAPWELHGEKLGGYQLAIVDRPAPSAAIPANRFDCAKCGQAVKADEDGCCATCGRDCTIVVDGAQPPPVLDLDALAEAERAMTAGAWKFANNTTCGIIGPDNRDLKAWHWHKSGDGADRRGVVALRNAAPHLIAKAREAVALRQELAALRAHFDAAAPEHNLPALLDLYNDRTTEAREKLAEAKRLGLEACTAWCRIVGSDGDDDGIAAVEKIAAELEAL